MRRKRRETAQLPLTVKAQRRR